MEYEPTGLISEEEITYARQDVHGTLGLLNALKHEYELHPIDLRPDRAYSPASIGKAYLRAMGIAEPMRKFATSSLRLTESQWQPTLGGEQNVVSGGGP